MVQAAPSTTGIFADGFLHNMSPAKDWDPQGGESKTLIYIQRSVNAALASYVKADFFFFKPKAHGGKV